MSQIHQSTVESEFDLDVQFDAFVSAGGPTPDGPLSEDTNCNDCNTPGTNCASDCSDFCVSGCGGSCYDSCDYSCLCQ